MAKAVKKQRTPKAKPEPRVWTEAARKMLFERLVSKFGPYAKWKDTNVEKSEDYIVFLSEFARIVGASGTSAVATQIFWATKPQAMNESSLFVYRALNVAAAFAGGFISADEGAIAMGYVAPVATTPKAA